GPFCQSTRPTPIRLSPAIQPDATGNVSSADNSGSFLSNHQPRTPPRPISKLEAEGEARLYAVVDQLEEVLVLVTGLVLEEVGEVIPQLDLAVPAEQVGEPNAGVGVALLQVHGAPLLA